MSGLFNRSTIKLFVVFLALPILLQACAQPVVVGTESGVRLAHDRRTAGTVIDDQLIEFKAASRIRKNKELKVDTNVNVTSYNNIVLLTGETKSNTFKSKIEDMIRGIPKVRRIHNELVIAQPSTRGSRLKDTWITTKAKTSLFKVRKTGFDPTRIKVVTENKTVFLLGLVTPDEGDAAVEQVRNISGVNKVVKVFEYIKYKNTKQVTNGQSGY